MDTPKVLRCAVSTPICSKLRGSLFVDEEQVAVAVNESNQIELKAVALRRVVRAEVQSICSQS